MMVSSESGRGNLRVALVLVALLLLIFVAGHEIYLSRPEEPLYPSPALTATRHLSDYFPAIKGTRADAAVYVFEGSIPGGTVLILGGTHPNEAAGFIAACVLLENVSISQGRLIVVPRANNSAFTHTDAGEAFPLRYTIDTPAGPRRFRYGSRFTNPLDQWPDPEVYLHHPSKQELSGGETRNLNRNFPGRAKGTFTERAAYAITSLVKAEKVDLVVDLHEASPEYPVINAIVANERAMDVAALANLTLQSEGMQFSLESSPANFRGLTHRELGDETNAMCILMESANVAQGRLRGKSEPQKMVTGVDNWYVRAARAGLVRVPYDSTGIPLTERVGRHLAGTRALIDAHNQLQSERPILLSNIPAYAELQTRGLGEFLKPKLITTISP